MHVPERSETQHSQKIWRTQRREEIPGWCRRRNDLYGSSTIPSSPVSSVLGWISAPLCTPLHTITLTVSLHFSLSANTNTFHHHCQLALLPFTITSHCQLHIILTVSLHFSPSANTTTFHHHLSLSVSWSLSLSVYISHCQLTPPLFTIISNCQLTPLPFTITSVS